jgi:hypothetical protein
MSLRNAGTERANVYREAARLMELNKVEFSCHAIVKAQTGSLPDVFNPERYPLVVEYAALFRPEHDQCGLWFFDGEAADEIQNHRVLDS